MPWSCSRMITATHSLWGCPWKWPEIAAGLKHRSVYVDGCCQIPACDSCVAGVILAFSSLLRLIQGVGYSLYKALYSLRTGYLKDHLTLQVSAQLPRSSGDRRLCVPPPVEVLLVGTRERASFVIVTLKLSPCRNPLCAISICRTFVKA